LRVVLRCPVRGCAEALRPEDSRWVCARKHSFDQRRSGALNLLQPQDRRSRNPGDSREAAQARRRLAQEGHDRAVHEALAQRLAPPRAPEHSTILDVGCGEGAFLRSLEGRPGLERHGTDISAFSLELAAKASPEVLFVVANADRFLPYADQSFDVVTSIDARVHGAEFRRITRKGGTVLVAVPGPDDLIELRQRIQSSSREKARAERILEVMGPPFILKERLTVRETRPLEPSVLRDLLVVTYRGFRRSEQEAVGALARLTVTMSHDILAFERG
jgi:23S rRNA (guanine745-N1)-methyltransferase